MSETERLPEPEPEIPDLPHLWMALESISILGMPMCRRLFEHAGTDIPVLYRLAQRPAADHIRAVSIMEIVERQGHGGLSNRDPLDDALGRLDRIKDIERQREAKGGGK